MARGEDAKFLDIRARLNLWINERTGLIQPEYWPSCRSPGHEPELTIDVIVSTRWERMGCQPAQAVVQMVDKLDHRGRIVEGLGDRALRDIDEPAKSERGVGSVSHR